MTRRTGVLALSAATGYVSLSQEILWMRVVSYWTGGKPTVFAHVLGVFLVGVALGALAGEKLCERQFPRGSRADRALCGHDAHYLGGRLLPEHTAALFLRARLGMIGVFGAVMLVSFLLGGIFPVLCHYAASENEAAGVTVSRIYLANIVGSTLGPLFTGFVLMQHFTTEEIILYLSLGTLLVGVIALPIEWSRGIVLRLALTTCVGGMILLSYHRLYDNLLERIQFRRQVGTVQVSTGEPERHHRSDRRQANAADIHLRRRILRRPLQHGPRERFQRYQARLHGRRSSPRPPRRPGGRPRQRILDSRPGRLRAGPEADRRRDQPGLSRHHRALSRAGLDSTGSEGDRSKSTMAGAG